MLFVTVNTTSITTEGQARNSLLMLFQEKTGGQDKICRGRFQCSPSIAFVRIQKRPKLHIKTIN